jgi:hypothetical protein
MKRDTSYTSADYHLYERQRAEVKQELIQSVLPVLSAERFQKTSDERAKLVNEKLTYHAVMRFDDPSYTKRGYKYSTLIL